MHGLVQMEVKPQTLENVGCLGLQRVAAENHVSWRSTTVRGLGTETRDAVMQSVSLNAERFESRGESRGRNAK